MIIKIVKYFYDPRAWPNPKIFNNRDNYGFIIFG